MSASITMSLNPSIYYKELFITALIIEFYYDSWISVRKNITNLIYAILVKNNTLLFLYFWILLLQILSNDKVKLLFLLILMFILLLRTRVIALRFGLVLKIIIWRFFIHVIKNVLISKLSFSQLSSQV